MKSKRLYNFIWHRSDYAFDWVNDQRNHQNKLNGWRK